MGISGLPGVPHGPVTKLLLGCSFARESGSTPSNDRGALRPPLRDGFSMDDGRGSARPGLVGGVGGSLTPEVRQGRDEAELVIAVAPKGILDFTQGS